MLELMNTTNIEFMWYQFNSGYIKTQLFQDPGGSSGTSSEINSQPS